MHVNGKVYKRGGKEINSYRRGATKRKGREKKKEREIRGKGNRYSDGQKSSDQEVKSIYSMSATLQEVGILPTLVYFPP